MNRLQTLALLAIAMLFHGCTVVRNNHSPYNILVKFSETVAQKDVEGFKDLFLNDKVSWLAVISDKDLMSVYKDKQKNKVNDHGLVEFIEIVSKTNKSTEVTFSDCRVKSDNDIAMAYCQYSFHLDGKMTNKGREGFLLVRTEAGWKISGMAFSSKLAEHHE